MAVKNYLSGTEGDQHFQAAISAKARHVLVSYLYIRKQKGNVLRKRVRANPGLKVMVDSGAHTFQISVKDPSKEYSKWTLKDYEQYLAEYAAFLRDNRKYIQCAVELDIDYCLNVIAGKDKFDPYGAAIVADWQKKYFQPLEELGLEIIYCWHEQRGIEGWEQMCSAFSYCGLPGEFSKQPDFNKYMAIARKYTTRVHGFAATKQSDFRDWPWYSIDSTTWKSSEIYGTLIHWDERRQKLFFNEKKEERRFYRRDFERNGLDADAIIHEKPGSYKLVTKYALISMVKMEMFYVRMFKIAKRIFYYQRRLPHPRLVNVFSDKKVRRWWQRMNAEDILTLNQNGTPEEHRDILYWLAMIQYRFEGVFKIAPAMKFLEAYFEELLKNAPGDIQTLQREISAMFSPPNPPALPRTHEEHYSSKRAPKARPAEEISADDVEWDVTANPVFADF